jgi:hypothetical protein
MDFNPLLHWLTADNLVKVIGIVAAAVAVAYQISQFKANSRSSIKADLEILKLLDASQPEYQRVKNHVDGLIRQFYPEQPTASKRGFTVYNRGEFASGIVCLLLFPAWTAYLIQTGSPWWALLTAFSAFTGFGLLLNGLDADRQSKKNP